MVMASKYELEVKVKGGTAYQKDGQKTLVHNNKFMPRWWVEDRNSHDNNEHYVIDEEATKDAYVQREKNMKENQLKAKRENVSMADLVGVVAEAVADKPKKKAKKIEVIKDIEDDNEELSIDAQIAHVQQELKEKGIKFHHKAGLEKLNELNQ